MRRRRSSTLLVGLYLASVTFAGCQYGGCAAALLEGTLRRHVDELVVVPADRLQPVERVKWPFPYKVEDRDGELVITDFFGSVKAREGDAVRLGGGEIADGTWGPCGLFEVGGSATS